MINRLVLLSTILLSALISRGQNIISWGSFGQAVNAKPFAGKRFRFEAAVKVKLIDPTAEAELWFRVDKPGRKMGFFYNMMDKPIRVKDWEVFTIEGRVDKDAEYAVFGGLYNRKGIFYFDNFKLSVEGENGNFEPVKIQDGDFESDSLNKYWGLNHKEAGYIVFNTKDEIYQGRQSCIVDGSVLKKNLAYGENDSTGKYISANGISIYCEEYGQGQPLLLLHGNRSSIESFKLQIPDFAKYYRVIAVDTRGQGKSTEDGKTYSYDLFAEDMNALLDSLKLDSVNVLGWSDGGNTGLIMAMKYPRKVKKLITMGANVFIDKTVVDSKVFKILDKQLKEIKADTSYTMKNRVRLVNLLLTEPRHGFEELKKISCPVLVMAGEKDAIKEHHTKSIAENIAGSKLLIAAGETHYYPIENPKTFNNVVIEFLKN